MILENKSVVITKEDIREFAALVELRLFMDNISEEEAKRYKKMQRILWHVTLKEWPVEYREHLK